MSSWVSYGQRKAGASASAILFYRMKSFDHMAYPIVKYYKNWMRDGSRNFTIPAFIWSGTRYG